jgi:hypothetical protein
METSSKELISIPSSKTIFIKCLNGNYAEKNKIIKLSIENGEKSVSLHCDDRIIFNKSQISVLKNILEFLET